MPQNVCLLVLQEAASLHDPFQAHLQAADKEELVELDKEVEGVMKSDRPTHEQLDKLLSMKVWCDRAAGLGVG